MVLRIGIEIEEESRLRLKAHAKRNHTTLGEVITAMLEGLTDEQIDQMAATRAAKHSVTKQEARALRAKIARLSPEKLKALVEGNPLLAESPEGDDGKDH